MRFAVDDAIKEALAVLQHDDSLRDIELRHRADPTAAVLARSPRAYSSRAWAEGTGRSDAAVSRPRVAAHCCPHIELIPS